MKNIMFVCVYVCPHAFHIHVHVPYPATHIRGNILKKIIYSEVSLTTLQANGSL